jgi:ABC-2 type transport system ATP-binding protein
LHSPKVILIAEPFAKCDETSITFISKIILGLAEDGVSQLILSEDASDLDEICDMIYRLEQGKIIEAYDPKGEQRADLPFMIPAKLEGKVALVNPVDILYVMAQDDRTVLETVDGRVPTQFTLSELEKRLSRSGFFRAHRGFLVNLQHVKEVIPYTRNSFTLRLRDADKTEIPLSKSAASELKELLGY